MDNAHIIFLMESHDAHCQHCGDRYIFKFPLPITDMVRRIEAFVLLHADCKEPDHE